MASKYDLAVVIGRFSPFHNGHHQLLKRALALAPDVLVLVGSSFRPRTPKDPFSYDERRVMLASAFDGPTAARLHCRPLRDCLYNDQTWLAGVQEAVQAHLSATRPAGSPPPAICVVGHEKDRSSAYLRMFPQWRFEPVGNTAGLSATELRDLLLDDALESAEGAPVDEAALADTARPPRLRADGGTNAAGRRMLLASAVPAPVLDFLTAFRATPAFLQVAREHHFLKLYRRQFAGLKYPPVFVTVDAVVVQSGHLLLVQRGAEPGRGLWALPGGFLDPDEVIRDAVLRELAEETRLKVPERVLRGSIRAAHVFDHPQRSLRGRTLTHAHLIVLEDAPGGLPEVRGGSDAKRARWFPLAAVRQMSEELFEDHADIIEHFVAML